MYQALKLTGGILLSVLSMTASGGPTLTGAELKALFSGGTQSGFTERGERFEGVFSANGTMVATVDFGMHRDTGRWWVRGDRFCNQWRRWVDGKTRCSTVEHIEDNKYRQHRDDGSQSEPWTMADSNSRQARTLAAVQSASHRFQADQRPFLEKGALTQLFSTSFTASGKHVKVKFLGNGSLEGTWNMYQLPAKGRWHIDGNKLCIRWTQLSGHLPNQCQRIEALPGNKYRSHWDDRRTTGDWTPSQLAGQSAADTSATTDAPVPPSAAPRAHSQPQDEKKLTTKQQALLDRQRESEQKAGAERRAQIRRLQEGLKTLGYYKRKVDGLTGPGTRQAIRRWSKATGYAFAGIDAALVKAVEAALQRPAKEAADGAPETVPGASSNRRSPTAPPVMADESARPPAIQPDPSPVQKNDEISNTPTPGRLPRASTPPKPPDGGATPFPIAKAAPERQASDAAAPNDVARRAPQSPLEVSSTAGADLFFSDLKQFVTRYPNALDTISLAETFTPAEREVRQGKFLHAESNFNRLLTLANANPRFVRFRRAQARARDVALEADRLRLLSNIRAGLETLKTRIAAAPFAPEAHQLTMVVQAYENIDEGVDLATLRKRSAELAVIITRFEANAAPVAPDPEQPRATAPEAGQLAPQTLRPAPKAPKVTPSPPAAPGPGQPPAVPTVATEMDRAFDIATADVARLFLEHIKVFATDNPNVLDSMALATSFEPANQEVEQSRFLRKGSRFNHLLELARSNELFSNFRLAQVRGAARAAAARRDRLRRNIATGVDTLKAKVAAAPFAPEAFDISKVVQQYSNIPKNTDLDTLQRLSEALAASIQKFIPGPAQTPVEAAGDAPTVSRPSPENKPPLTIPGLTDVRQNDVTFLLHLSPRSPNAYRDLGGKVQFQDSRILACAPGYERWNRQLKYFFSLELDREFPKHVLITQRACDTLDGIDAIVALGVDLARDDGLPAREALQRAIQSGDLVPLFTVKQSALSDEIARRRIVARQYRTDILEGARVGFGAVSGSNDSPVACIVLSKRRDAHVAAIDEAVRARAFQFGTATRKRARVSINVAYKNLQKGSCGLVYANQIDLKALLDATRSSRQQLTVLPVWTSKRKIGRISSQLAEQAKLKSQSEADRRAAVKRKAVEDQARRIAQSAELARQQAQFRRRHGAKVASLVAGIDGSLKEMRETIEHAVASAGSARAAVTTHRFWGGLPRWYAKQRQSGWEFESTVATPKDYGLARWKNREVESVVARVRFLMKHRKLGEYNDTCWHAGYLLDKEFAMKREPYVAPCAGDTGLRDWQASTRFDSRWDLGIQ
jgi:peptidoglycan hydrolase-like protein with peptidoglycan-binding domain